MIEVAAGCLTASLVGSLHCAGMCGPLVAVAVGGGAGHARGDAPSALRLQLAYHGARGVGYVTLGVVLGLVGQLANLAGTLAGLAPVAAGLAGLTLIVSGLMLIAKSLGLTLRRGGEPGPFRRWLQRTQARAFRLPRTTRALAIGATTALLPCGWLYAFFVIAAGTGTPLGGAVVMFAFWLGTVPILAALGLGVDGLKRRFGPTLQVAASLVLIGLGTWTLLGRTQLDAESLAGRASGGEQHSCCEPSDAN